MKRWSLAFVASTICATSAALAAPPAAPVVVGGNATISGGTVAVNTSGTPSGTVNWQAFNIGSSQIAGFVQPSGSIAILNRVAAPVVQGAQVLLANPGGIATISGGSGVPLITGAAKTPSTTAALISSSTSRFADGAVTIRMPLVDATPISIR